MKTPNPNLKSLNIHSAIQIVEETSSKLIAMAAILHDLDILQKGIEGGYTINKSALVPKRGLRGMPSTINWTDPSPNGANGD